MPLGKSSRSNRHPASPSKVLKQKRSITPEDLLAYQMVGEPRISPDGSRVLFIRRHANEKKQMISNLWIIDTKESVILYADMPGVDEGSVDVTIDKNVLNISGVVKPPEFEGRSIAYAEYDTGDYDRSFTISDDIDREKVEALVKNGVLRLVLHKAPEAAVKKITVRAE